MRLYLKDLSNYPINRRKDEIKRYLTLKLKEKIAFNLQNAIFFCTFQYGTILKYESL